MEAFVTHSVFYKVDASYYIVMSQKLGLPFKELIATLEEKNLNMEYILQHFGGTEQALRISSHLISYLRKTIQSWYSNHHPCPTGTHLKRNNSLKIMKLSTVVVVVAEHCECT